MKNIGFIGLGNMGAPMAINLCKSHKVTVFDINKDNCKSAADSGAIIADNINDLIGDKEFIITMLPAGKHVESVYFSENLIDSIDKKTILIDCSTIAPTKAKELQKKCSDKNINMIDAPVSGGVGGAQKGTLSFLVGGNTTEFELAKPILECMGKNILHAGDGGCGQVAKMCNNMLLAIHMIGSSEALILGEKNGLSPKILTEIMNVSSGRNWSLDTYNPFPGVMENTPASNNYAGGFGVPLMIKDLNLSQDNAKSINAKTPLGELSLKLYNQHLENGGKNLDFSSIINHLK